MKKSKFKKILIWSLVIIFGAVPLMTSILMIALG